MAVAFGEAIVAGADSMGAGQVATLGRDIIHSVANPIAKLTSAIHVFGGDFFNPPRLMAESMEPRKFSRTTLGHGPYTCRLPSSRDALLRRPRGGANSIGSRQRSAHGRTLLTETGAPSDRGPGLRPRFKIVS